METPEVRADRLISEILNEVIGPRGQDTDMRVREEIWRVLEREKVVTDENATETLGGELRE